MTNFDREAAERHTEAMRIVEETAAAFSRGGMSFNAAKRIIDAALMEGADRIVRVGETHKPEVQT